MAFPSYLPRLLKGNKLLEMRMQWEKTVIIYIVAGGEKACVLGR